LLFLIKKDGDQALRLERQALAARPEWLPARSSILEILLSRRDFAAAKIEIEGLKKTFPNHPQTRYFEAV
jgi:hypothetical protein